MSLHTNLQKIYIFAENIYIVGYRLNTVRQIYSDLNNIEQNPIPLGRPFLAFFGQSPNVHYCFQSLNLNFRAGWGSRELNWHCPYVPEGPAAGVGWARLAKCQIFGNIW